MKSQGGGKGVRRPRGAKGDNCRGASADGSRIDRELAIGPWGLRAASLSTCVLGLLSPADVCGVWRQLEPVDQVVDRQLRVERSQGNQSRFNRLDRANRPVDNQASEWT
jgi:hypothetical protein